MPTALEKVEVGAAGDKRHEERGFHAGEAPKRHTVREGQAKEADDHNQGGRQTTIRLLVGLQLPDTVQDEKRGQRRDHAENTRCVDEIKADLPRTGKEGHPEKAGVPFDPAGTVPVWA